MLCKDVFLFSFSIFISCYFFFKSWSFLKIVPIFYLIYWDLFFLDCKPFFEGNFFLFVSLLRVYWKVSWASPEDIASFIGLKFIFEGFFLFRNSWFLKPEHGVISFLTSIEKEDFLSLALFKSSDCYVLTLNWLL